MRNMLTGVCLAPIEWLQKARSARRDCKHTSRIRAPYGHDCNPTRRWRSTREGLQAVEVRGLLLVQMPLLRSAKGCKRPAKGCSCSGMYMYVYINTYIYILADKYLSRRGKYLSPTDKYLSCRDRFLSRRTDFVSANAISDTF